MTTATMAAKETKAAAKCPSVTPVARKDAKGQPLRYGTINVANAKAGK